jgi:hypothetical protein
MHPQVVQELLGHGQKECYVTLAEVYFRQFAIDYYTRLVLQIPKNEARLVNTDSMRNCINWRWRDAGGIARQ